MKEAITVAELVSERALAKVETFDATQYGLTSTRAAEMAQTFQPMLDMMKALEVEYNAIVQLPIAPETCQAAKALRQKYVKVRTGTAKIHTEMKAYYLQGGRAVDGWKNYQLHAAEEVESNLKEIENYYENREAETRAALTVERTDELRKYGREQDAEFSDLGNMPETVWTNYITGVRVAFEQQRKAEQEAAELAKKAEAERIANEKAEAAERERMRQENELLKKQQADRDRVEAAEKADREKAEADRRAKEDQERQRIENEREAERKAADQKQRDLESKHQAELQAAKEAQEKARIETERVQRLEAQRLEKERLEKEDETARANDLSNRRTKNNAIVLALVTEGISESAAKKMVTAIAKGKIPHISILY